MAELVLAMQSLGFLLLFISFFAEILATQSFQLAELRKPKGHVALFVFGDSIYDPGNNNFLNISIDNKSNFPPYGETFFKFPTGRPSDGRLIPDFIALHANLPLWKPYLAPGKQQLTNGANFASAGASVLPGGESGPLDFEIQLGFFKNVATLLRQQLGDEEAKELVMNAVYLSGMGGVDYLVFESKYPNATESVKQEYIKWVIGNITDGVKEIYKLGGRKFAFQNVLPLGCMPLVRQQSKLKRFECDEEMLELERSHNIALVNACKELESELPGLRYLIFDAYNALMERIKNPSEYGFRYADSSCCGRGTYNAVDCGIGEYEVCEDPNEYLFFDGEHPTEHAYSQIAELLWSGEPNVTSPLNMKQLVELETHSEI